MIKKHKISAVSASICHSVKTMDTIKSKSEMTSLHYDTMKEGIVGEIMKVRKLNSSTYDANQKDAVHLNQFKQGN